MGEMSTISNLRASCEWWVSPHCSRIQKCEKLKFMLKLTVFAVKTNGHALIFDQEIGVLTGSFPKQLFCFLSYFLSQRFPIWDVS